MCACKCAFDCVSLYVTVDYMCEERPTVDCVYSSTSVHRYACTSVHLYYTHTHILGHLSQSNVHS